MDNTSIVVAGQKFDIGCRVILWDEPNGYNLYRNKKYTPRDLDLDSLKKEIKSFTIHHSVTWNAKQVYSSLIGRNLSVNFILDDDNNNGYATLYQCLDVKDAGWSQTICNMSGPGCEIALQPAAWIDAHYYSEANQKNFNCTPHTQIEDTVHGAKFKCFGPTEAQHNTIINMLGGFFKAFDTLPKRFPRNEDGSFVKTLIHDPASYRGILNHFNIDRNKIDCLGIDLQKIEDGIDNLTSHPKICEVRDFF